MNKPRIRSFAALAALVLSLCLLGGSVLVSRGPADTESAARALETQIGRRLAVLGDYMDEALATDREEWLRLDGLPSDMVIYRYREDTLQSWAHQFPIVNDDIRSRTVLPRLGGSRSPLVSPLTEVTSRPGYFNFGPKWYLAYAVEDGEGTLVVGGLEMVDELDGPGGRGINPRLRVNPRFTLQPLSSDSGSSVSVGGVPLLKVASEGVETVRLVTNDLLFWLGIFVFLFGTLLLLSARRTLLRCALAFLLQAFLLAALYFYGRVEQASSLLFSPVLYADGSVLYSLGAVLTLNLLIFLAVVDLYLVRGTALKRLAVRGSRTAFVLTGLLLLALAALTCAYIHLSFRSIVLNSGITLELYKITSLTLASGLVYLSYFLLALTVALLVQMASSSCRRVLSLRYDVLSRTGRIVVSVLTALYFVTASSLLGFRKEQNRVEVWSNRLAMDRDIGLELQLRGMENAIATDPVIAVLASLQNSNGLIQNRLADAYMARLTQDYDISVILLSGADSDPVLLSLLATRIGDGVRIAEDSRFFYSRDMSGRPRYTGVFSYYTRAAEAVDILVGVESKSNREDRGYLSLLGISGPGRFTIPVNYSYAKYVSDHLVSYKGNYGYPTYLAEGGLGLEPGRHASMTSGGYTHFVQCIADDEVVVISREQTSPMSYLVVGLLVAILFYLLLYLVSRRRDKGARSERSYYRSRITAVLYAALTLTLVAMAVLSVYFVYRRNDKDMQAMMTSKINAIQTMVQSNLRQAASLQELRGQEVMGTLDYTANVLKSDITLYTPAGRVYMTTTPEIFDRMIIGRRINEDALNNIVYDHRRYYIHREQLSSHRFYTLYAPVFGSDGGMIAIVSSPYTDQSYDLETEAASHIVTILTLFLLLLILARILTTAVISRMFKPLSEMGAKMNVADIDHLEYIHYEQDDEIASLVTAYNRMVSDLSESSRQLAQAERDKAWSAMARQVAHEIKNPLTPIKLQLQMLIRMKQSGNPAWENKFDEVAGVILEHIDVLAATANEFSTFAKLYSEDPVPIDLDALIRDEVTMYSSREDIEINYFGLAGAGIEGPKPQLTRVLVNLINNAVQAIDLYRESEAAAGRTAPPGVINISLRHSTREGYYDIVVEDNGPGVPDEYLDRLFAPNFTTKSGGTGLGLAISRTVIERCKGEIFYAKSFTLGGASFTVRYPKP